MNLVMIEGFVGLDPKFIPCKNGLELVKLSVATTEKWKDRASQEDRSKTEWHNVTIFELECVQYVKEHVRKGSLVYLEGQLVTNKWHDKDGVNKKSVDIVVLKKNKHKIYLKEKGEQVNQNNQQTQNTDEISMYSMFLEDDRVPF